MSTYNLKCNLKNLEDANSKIKFSLFHNLTILFEDNSREMWVGVIE
jgi:hypothetical protein